MISKFKFEDEPKKQSMNPDKLKGPKKMKIKGSKNKWGGNYSSP